MLFVIIEKQSVTVGTSVETLKYYYHYYCRILTILPMRYGVYNESKFTIIITGLDESKSSQEASR